MHRSPFGVLNEEYFPHEKRSLQVSQSQQEPFVGLGGARRMSSARPRSAPGHRKSSISSGSRPSSASGLPTSHFQASNSSSMLREESATMGVPQRTESPTPLFEQVATSTLLDYNEENRKMKKTINNVELSQEDWNKILIKYNIQDIASMKYNYLKKGTGFTTKLDGIAKERPKSASAARLRKSTSSFAHEAFDESKDIHESMPEDDVIEDVAIHFMRERNNKKKQEEEEFAKQLQKEKEHKVLQIKRCIEEMNQFCQFLQKPCSYRYLDDKQVEKEVAPSQDPQVGISGIVHKPTGVFSDLAKTAFWSARYAETPELNPQSRPSSANNKKKKPKSSQHQSNTKTLSLAKFYQEHEQLYKEYKHFMKHNNAGGNIESMKPMESNHFIGVDDLYTSARKHEEEMKLKEERQQQMSLRNTSQPSTSSKSKKAVAIRPSTSDDEYEDYHAADVDANYNEVLRRNEVIAMQQKIIEEYDQIQELLVSQISEVQSKGWNIQFRDNFLTSDYLR